MITPEKIYNAFETYLSNEGMATDQKLSGLLSRFEKGQQRLAATMAYHEIAVWLAGGGSPIRELDRLLILAIVKGIVLGYDIAKSEKEIQELEDMI